VSGHREDAPRLVQLLDNTPIHLDHAVDLQQARNLLRQNDYQVVLTEATLPDGTWVDVLHFVRHIPGDPEVIVTDPHADARFWSQALNRGAYDVLSQPFYEPEVRRILGNACSRSRYASAAT
jgi:two-component system response regulator AtoC